MNYNQAIEELSNRGIRNVKLGLERITALLEKLDNPHHNLKYIHVAGTNGKGSTCAMLSTILSLQQYKIGLFTSPALFNFTERFKINNKEIPQQEFVELYKKVKQHITDETFFEIITAIAFLYFKQNNVDIVVLEVGLGGRFDATNVIRDEDIIVSIITTIGLDHSDYLGNTIKQIAFEKAGIIRKNLPVITAAKTKALMIIKQVAKEKNAPVITTRKAKYHLGLLGEYQKVNASLVLEAIKIIRSKGFPISDKNVMNGLQNTKWPGRLEFIEKNVLIDCAHNLSALQTLVKEVKSIKKEKKFKNCILVYGTNKKDELHKMIPYVEKLSKKIILSKSDFPKAMNLNELEAIFTKPILAKIENINDALAYAKDVAQKQDLILITGSCYLIGGLDRN